MSEPQDVHLFLFVHGLWGTPNHMNSIERAVKRLLQGVLPEKVVTIKPSSFRSWKTYDGIMRCAQRAVADLLFEMEALGVTNGAKVTKISIVGYSLGGLILRCIIGILEDLGFFAEVEPVFFCTFATPHVGVRFFKRSLFGAFANTVGARLFGQTGLELFVVDSAQLLVALADPTLRYVRGLRRFQKRILMANIKNDRTVAFYTSYITSYSPFDSLLRVHVKYLDDMPSAQIAGVTVWPKFVDLRQSRASEAKVHRDSQEDPSLMRTNVYVRYLFFLCVTPILPLYLPIIFSLTLYVSLYSMAKTRLLRKIDIELHWQKVKSAVYRGGVIDAENAQQGQDNRRERRHVSHHDSFKGETSNLTRAAMENVLAGDVNFTHRPTEMIDEEDSTLQGDELAKASIQKTAPAVDYSSSNSDTTDGAPKKSLKSLWSRKLTIDVDAPENDRVIRVHEPSLENGKQLASETEFLLFNEHTRLPLTDTVQGMVDNLNGLDWVKIPVFHDVFNAHNSVVARRGETGSPKGAATLYFWGSILRTHIMGAQANAEAEAGA